MTQESIIIISTTTTAIIAAIGPTGSLIEMVGNSFKLPRVIAFGKLLESTALDIPKFTANILAIFTGVQK